MSEFIIHKSGELGPSVDILRFSRYLHIPDQFIPSPVQIVGDRYLGAFPVLYNCFGKIFGMISGMNGETRYNFTFIYLIKCDRFLENKEIFDNNAPAGDNDLLAGISE